MKKKEFYKYIIFIVLFFATIIRLYLASKQMMTITPGSAPIDDDLYYRWANSIVKGEWLGQFDYMTLSKYPFFAVYLAVLHVLGIPVLIANAVLWILFGILAVVRFAPVIKNRILQRIMYLAIIYNPSTWAIYTLRVYRDSIFPALCVAFFVATAGMVLRIKEKTSSYIPFSIISGISIGTAWITREDGYWLLPFGIAATAIALAYILTDKELKNKILRIIALFVPYLITALCVLFVCAVNNKYYGVFVLTDFSKGSFAECYGNMTRLSHEDWNPIVAVPKDVREKMYEECPSFGILKDELEKGGKVYKSFANKQIGDYKSGSFYWALRRAAQINGIYESPETAELYWKTLSKEISQLCEKDPYALRPRSSVTPPIKSDYVLPVIATSLESIKYIFSMEHMRAYDKGLSDITSPQLFEYMEFYHDDSNYAAIEGSSLPYHSRMQSISYKFMGLITAIYKVVIIPAFIASIFGWVKSIIKFKDLSYKRQIVVFVLFGLVMMSLFRIAIVSFMEVAAFGIGIYAMYLGAVYPMIVITAYIGNTLWINE